MTPQRKYSTGQSAVLFTLVIATLLGACALGADVGVLYFNWVKLQKASDSAAIAGAAQLTGYPCVTGDAVCTAATNAAVNYAEYNGMKSGEIVSTTVSSDGQSMTVKLQRTVPYAFATVLGLSTGIVSTTSTAALAATSTPEGEIPIGLQCTSANAVAGSCTCASKTYQAPCNGSYLPYMCQVDGGTCTWTDANAANEAATAANYCNQDGGNCTAAGGTMTIAAEGSPPPAYQLHQGFIDNATGNWADLNLSTTQGSAAGKSFFDQIAYGYSANSPPSVGTQLYTNTGAQSEPIIKAFTTRIGSWQPPNSTPSLCLSNDTCASDPQTVLIPLVDFGGNNDTGVNGKSAPVTVTGFAMGYIVGSTGGGSNMNLEVYFLGTPAPNNGVITSNNPCIPGNTTQSETCVPHLID